MSRHRIVDSGDTSGSGRAGGGIVAFFAGSALTDVFNAIVVAAAAAFGDRGRRKGAERGGRQEGFFPLCTALARLTIPLGNYPLPVSNQT